MFTVQEALIFFYLKKEKKESSHQLKPLNPLLKGDGVLQVGLEWIHNLKYLLRRFIFLIYFSFISFFLAYLFFYFSYLSKFSKIYA